jgi:hypothetical protein
MGICISRNNQQIMVNELGNNNAVELKRHENLKNNYKMLEKMMAMCIYEHKFTFTNLLPGCVGRLLFKFDNVIKINNIKEFIDLFAVNITEYLFKNKSDFKIESINKDKDGSDKYREAIVKYRPNNLHMSLLRYNHDMPLTYESNVLRETYFTQESFNCHLDEFLLKIYGIILDIALLENRVGFNNIDNYNNSISYDFDGFIKELDKLPMHPNIWVNMERIVLNIIETSQQNKAIYMSYKTELEQGNKMLLMETDFTNSLLILKNLSMLESNVNKYNLKNIESNITLGFNILSLIETNLNRPSAPMLPEAHPIASAILISDSQLI